jgi:L-seryl-tRNA(Ser) seleniumtransferase
MAAPKESVVHGSTARPQDLPSVDQLLRLAGPAALLAEHGHTLVVKEARALLDACRAQAVAGTLGAPEVRHEALANALAARVQARLAPRMRAVLNLTGTVIHTNLGRALLADAALQRLLAVMTSPNNLEYDLATGSRGDRDSLVEELLCGITGAEAATVVNNNAAAVLLTHRGAGARARGDRLARRAGRDRRRLPHARRDGQRRLRAWSRWAPPTARTRRTTSAPSTRRPRW